MPGNSVSQTVKAWAHLLPGHECDTDLCGGCVRSLLPGSGPAACAMGTLACCNMRLRFRQHKRIAMGKSDIAGWGSFLMVRSPARLCEGVLRPCLRT